MYGNRTAYSLAAIVVFIVIIAVVNYHGYSNRVFATDRVVLTIDRPDKAYNVWQEKKVRGRILLLFDDYPHMGGRRYYEGVPQLTNSNLIEYSIFHNIIRRIYFMVPEADWEDFRQRETVGLIRQAPNMERGIYLFSMSGVLIIAATPSSLPSIPEKTLVYINRRIFDYKQTLETLAQKEIPSDIVISYMGAR